jgi:hypothetical protein
MLLKFRREYLLLFAIGITGVQPVLAQLGSATISGSVSDSTGGTVAGATVTVVNADTSFKRVTTTNSVGQYSVPGLTPGAYNLSVELQGFKKFQQTGMTLQVDQNAEINVILEVGQLTEIVEIQGQAPLVESTSASMGAVIDTQKITQLPLNGRNFVQLALLVPGANTGAPGATNGGGFSVGGARSEQNAFQIDGTSNSDSYQNRVSVTPNIDGILEFKIQTNNYSAEFGKGAGAQVNLVTRSGSREFHGTLYEFWRNNVTQARRFFDRNRVSFPCDRSDPNTLTRRACAPPFNQNQFGFTLGGPVFFVPKSGGERKTFFFTTYEGFRQVRGNATVANMASVAQRSGDFSQNLVGGTTVADALGRTYARGTIFDPLSSTAVTTASGQTRYVRTPFEGNRIPRSRFDPVSARIIADTQFFPLPNDRGTTASNGDPQQNFLDGRSRRDNFDQFSGRIDHQFSPNDTFYGRFTFNDANSYNPRTYPGFGDLNSQRNLNGTLSYVKVLSPTKVNEARFGYLGWFQLQASEDIGVPWNEKLGIRGLGHLNPGLQGSPDITITGTAGLGNGGGPLRRRSNTFQFIDNLSFNAGRHFMKAGFEIRRVRDNVLRAQTTRGSFPFENPQWTGIDGVGNTGHTFAAFLLGLARQKGRRISDFYTSLRGAEYGAYVQDDFKVSSNLTLNIGIRYQLYIPPKDVDDELSTIVFPQRCPTFTTPGCAATTTLNSPFVPTFGVAEGQAAKYKATPLPRSISPVDKKNFGPRFGFAWQPFGNKQTVVRGGYAIFYDTVPMILTEDSIQNWPFVIEDQIDLGFFHNGPPPPEGFFGFLVDRPSADFGTGPVASYSPGPNAYSKDFRNAYLQNWNFGIQRQLPGNTVVEIAYVGNKATRLNRRQNVNTAEPLGFRYSIPDLTNNPNIPSNIGSGRNQFRRLMPFANWNGIIVPLSNAFETTSTAFANYHGLQTRLEKRFSAGLTVLATYTWAKAISDAAAFNGGGDADTGNRIQNILDLKADKGLANQDHRHRFTTAYVYDLPFGKGRRFGSSWTGALDKIAGGWGLDGIISLQTGYPITVRRAGDPLGIGTEGAARPDLICNPNLPKGEQTVERFFRTSCFAAPESLLSGDVRYGTAGRTTVTGPGIANWDLSIRKNTAITERFQTEFRAEFFNALNHANWLLTGSARDFGNSAFGVVQNTLDPRIIQFGLKLRF